MGSFIFNSKIITTTTATIIIVMMMIMMVNFLNKFFTKYLSVFLDKYVVSVQFG